MTASLRSVRRELGLCLQCRRKAWKGGRCRRHWERKLECERKNYKGPRCKVKSCQSRQHRTERHA